MKAYGPRSDPDGVVQHAPVSDAVDYGQPITCWGRRVGAGTILCELVRPSRTARRIVRLTATYMDGDVDVHAICFPTDEADEQASIKRLENRMLTVQIKPSEGLEQTPKS